MATKAVIIKHLQSLSPAEFKKKHGMTKTEARRKHGLDSKSKMPKDPKIPSSNKQDSMGGRYQHGKSQYKVGPTRQGVNQVKGRSVNKNLKNPKK